LFTLAHDRVESALTALMMWLVTHSLLIIVFCTHVDPQQIEQWFEYNYKKAHGPNTRQLDSKTFDPTDPLTILKSRLVGLDLSKPCAAIPYNVFARENKQLVEDEYD